jgi:hypothetical protein
MLSFHAFAQVLERQVQRVLAGGSGSCFEGPSSAAGNKPKTYAWRGSAALSLPGCLVVHNTAAALTDVQLHAGGSKLGKSTAYVVDM